MISKARISAPNNSPSSNNNPVTFIIEADSYSEEENNQNSDDNDENVSEDEYSTTTEPLPPISKVPIFISSPKIPDDIVLPNIPAYTSNTDSESTTGSVSAITFDQSSLETSHISSILIESTNDPPNSKDESLAKDDHKITSSSSSSSSYIHSVKNRSSKEQVSTKKRFGQKHFKMKKPIKQQSEEEQDIKQKIPKERGNKQSNIQQKKIKQASSQSEISSNQAVVKLTPRRKELSEDNSDDIYSSSITMTSQSGIFSEYSTTSTSSISLEKDDLTDYSSLSKNKTIKTSVYDESKAAQRTIPPEPPTVCCALI